MQEGTRHSSVVVRYEATDLHTLQEPYSRPESTCEPNLQGDEAEMQRPGPPRTATTSTVDSEIWNEKGASQRCLQQRAATSFTIETSTHAWGDRNAFTTVNLPHLKEFSESTEMLGKRAPTFDDSKLKSLRKYHHPGKQLRKLLLDGLCRWAVTTVLILCLYMALWHYSNKEVMSRAKKLQFNALVTGLSIGLSLSIADSLKQMALELRWWILSRRKRSLYEVDLILNVDSPSHVVKLLLARPRFNVILAIFLWLLLNLGAQIGVALLGLTYSVDSADNQALTTRGNVSIPDLSELATEKVVSTKSTSDSALQYTANSFGTLALALGYDVVSEKPGLRALLSEDTNMIFLGDDYAQYIFYESSPDIATNPNGISITTNRTINATASCGSWPVVDGGDGSKLNITFMLDSSGHKSYAGFPIAAGISQSTYVTRPSKTCSDGCATIYALEASTQNPFFYKCNVTVSKVENAMRREHEIGIDLRNMAANAIALQGYAASSLTNDPDLQYQTYPAESIYGSPQNGSATSMALLMAQFAMGVVAVAAQNNPTLIVPGNQPQAGVTLNITSWKNVHLILGLTGGVQLILFLIAAFIANRVVVKDKSYLAVARLLAPMVSKLGFSGSVATGREISDLFGDEEKFVYSVGHASQEDLLRLDLGQQKPLRGFPEGMYD